MKRSLTLAKFLALAMAMLMLVAVVASCAQPGDDDVAADTTTAAVQDPNTPADTNNPGDETTAATAETEPPYEYADVNYGGADFMILNAEDRYNMIYHITIDDITGDKLEDERYAVNADIQDQYGIVIKETAIPYADIQVYAQNEILSGNGVHDVFYLAVKQIAALMSQGHMQNLLDIEQFDPEDEWWDQLLVDGGMLNDKYLYYLGGNYHLQAFEGTTCFYFNKRMMTDLGLEFPYGLVRDGKWTLDKLYEYAGVAANLNGDESFDKDSAPNAIYGYAGITNMMPAFIMGCDAYYVEKDENGYPVIAFTSERFTNACEKIAKFTSSAGLYVTDTTLSIFQSGRALFMGSEIKAAANEMREMPDEFGLLPIPKYDDAQEKYIANLFWATHLLSIPATCKDSERAAIVMDALNYEANERVMPLYYERVCYKGLRDDDSIEMLQLIRDGRYLNWGLAYGWLDSVEPGVHAQLLAGNGNVASLIKAGNKVVNTLIGKTMKSFE